MQDDLQLLQLSQPHSLLLTLSATSNTSNGLCVQLLSPLPQEAHAADMVLVAEDGQAHLIHSLLVQRLSPGMLGTMIAAARAQHGTGESAACLPARCPRTAATAHGLAIQLDAVSCTQNRGCLVAEP